MEALRWGGAALLLGSFLVIAVSNWFVFWNGFIRGRHAGSWVPVVGGPMGALGLLLIPVRGSTGFWWLPLLLDWGCAPGVGHALLYHGWRLIRGPRPGTIFVAVLEEGLAELRPVEAAELPNGLFKILEEPADRTERWRFTTGSVVRCTPQSLPDGQHALVAVEAPGWAQREGERDAGSTEPVLVTPGLRVSTVRVDDDAIEVRIDVSDGMSFTSNQVYVGREALRLTLSALGGFMNQAPRGAPDARLGDFGQSPERGALDVRVGDFGRSPERARSTSAWATSGRPRGGVCSTSAWAISDRSKAGERFVPDSNM